MTKKRSNCRKEKKNISSIKPMPPSRSSIKKHVPYNMVLSLETDRTNNESQVKATQLIKKGSNQKILTLISTKDLNKNKLIT